MSTSKGRLPETGTSRRPRWPWIVAAVATVVAAVLAYAAIPRHADLTRFDPDEMARLETLAWRHYYEKRYLPLFTDLYEMSRREQGYSPLDSVRLAVAAGRAAKAFQPSKSRAEAEAAIPYLVDYFRMLARAAPVQVDVEDAARTELAWWQARREAVPPEQYGAIIARVTTLLYGAEGEDVRRSAVIRAEVMDYRDAHSENTSEADWAKIEDQLQLAYRLLKKAVSSRERQS
jgi:hypothetical protein